MQMALSFALGFKTFKSKNDVNAFIVIETSN